MRSDAELRKLVAEKKGDIGPRWQQLVLETYPPETFEFLKNKKDRFDNPIGHTVAEMVTKVLEGIASGAEAEEYRSAIYPVIQVRAVQGFSPSQAMDAVLLLKRAVFETVGIELLEAGECAVLLSVGAKVDELLGLAFDVYSDCRERIHQIRTDEVKRNLYMLLKDKNVLDVKGKGHE
jgi:hypothetical protein